MPTWVTHRVLDPRKVHVRLLQPVIEVLGVVGGVPLTVGGHAEHGQGLLNLWQAAQVGLGGQRQGQVTMTTPAPKCRQVSPGLVDRVHLKSKGATSPGEHSEAWVWTAAAGSRPGVGTRNTVSPLEHPTESRGA